MISFIFKILGKIPLGVSYHISTALAWLAGRVVKYRRKVIIRNLTTSFPNKDQKEIEKIADRFYRFLTDYFFETMRMGEMSKKEMNQRMTFENLDLIESLVKEGRPIALMLGHYCNWEWITSIAMHLKQGIGPCHIYHPLENRSADKALLKIRNRFGSVSVPLRDTLRYILKIKRKGLDPICGFIADQAPGYDSTHLWIDFLNHETGVFSGPEKIARRLNGAMVYCHITRPRRGFYHCRLELISNDVTSTEEFDPTREYFRRLEQQIRDIPEFWLWSHRRWKRPRMH